MDAEHSGTVGWGLLGAGVLAWDLMAPETLTSAFKRGLEHPVGRPLLIGWLGVTALHLTGLMPRKGDPYYLLIDHGPLRFMNVDKGPTISD